MKNYIKKFNYLWCHQDTKCAVTGEALTIGVQMHHVVANTKMNQRLYPLYIDCVWNLQLVDINSHANAHHWVSHFEAAKRELFLKNHPVAARFMNCPEIFTED